MKRVITSYSGLPSDIRSLFDIAQSSSDLPTVNFPNKGQLTKAIIFEYEDTIYLVKMEKLQAFHRDGDDEKESKEIEALEATSGTAEAKLD